MAMSANQHHRKRSVGGASYFQHGNIQLCCFQRNNSGSRRHIGRPPFMKVKKIIFFFFLVILSSALESLTLDSGELLKELEGFSLPQEVPTERLHGTASKVDKTAAPFGVVSGWRALGKDVPAPCRDASGEGTRAVTGGGCMMRREAHAMLRCPAGYHVVRALRVAHKKGSASDNEAGLPGGKQPSRAACTRETFGDPVLECDKGYALSPEKDCRRRLHHDPVPMCAREFKFEKQKGLCVRKIKQEAVFQCPENTTPVNGKSCEMRQSTTPSFQCPKDLELRYSSEPNTPPFCSTRDVVHISYSCPKGWKLDRKASPSCRRVVKLEQNLRLKCPAGYSPAGLQDNKVVGGGKGSGTRCVTVETAQPQRTCRASGFVLLERSHRVLVENQARATVFSEQDAGANSVKDDVKSGHQEGDNPQKISRKVVSATARWWKVFNPGDISMTGEKGIRKRLLSVTATDRVASSTAAYSVVSGKALCVKRVIERPAIQCPKGSTLLKASGRRREDRRSLGVSPETFNRKQAGAWGSSFLHPSLGRWEEGGGSRLQDQPVSTIHSLQHTASSGEAKITPGFPVEPELRQSETLLRGTAPVSFAQAPGDAQCEHWRDLGADAVTYVCPEGLSIDTGGSRCLVEERQPSKAHCNSREAVLRKDAVKGELCVKSVVRAPEAHCPKGYRLKDGMCTQIKQVDLHVKCPEGLEKDRVSLQGTPVVTVIPPASPRGLCTLIETTPALNACKQASATSVTESRSRFLSPVEREQTSRNQNVSLERPSRWLYPDTTDALIKLSGFSASLPTREGATFFPSSLKTGPSYGTSSLYGGDPVLLSSSEQINSQLTYMDSAVLGPQQFSQFNRQEDFAIRNQPPAASSLYAESRGGAWNEKTGLQFLSPSEISRLTSRFTEATEVDKGHRDGVSIASAYDAYNKRPIGPTLEMTGTHAFSSEISAGGWEIAPNVLQQSGRYGESGAKFSASQKPLQGDAREAYHGGAWQNSLPASFDSPSMFESSLPCYYGREKKAKLSCGKGLRLIKDEEVCVGKSVTKAVRQCTHGTLLGNSMQCSAEVTTPVTKICPEGFGLTRNSEFCERTEYTEGTLRCPEGYILGQDKRCYFRSNYLYV